MTEKQDALPAKTTTTAAGLPQIAEEPELRPDEQQRVQTILATLDLEDLQSVIKFGSAAQQELQVISGNMLDGVRNKDVGPAGKSLRDIVLTIKGFDTEELNPERKASWWERLFGKARPVADFIEKYEDVRGQIDRITDELLAHEGVLLRDIRSLDGS